MNLILLGAPGAGKGTQAEIICEKFSIPAISTGNIIRDALKSGTELGKRAKSYMDEGKLVPDDVVISIIKERLSKEDCKDGFILDGFPRTIAQAEALDKLGVDIDYVIDIKADDEVIISRLSGRRVCQDCGAVYHLKNKKPKKDGICDKCAGTLVQRKDDRKETIMERLRVYHEQTEPLKEFYARRGILYEVKDTQSIQKTASHILEILGEAG